MTSHTSFIFPSIYDHPKLITTKTKQNKTKLYQGKQQPNMTESPPTEDNQDNNDKYVHEEEEDEDEDDAQEEMGCDLASLFINTEYVTQSITIPCHYSQQSNNNHNHNYNNNHEEKDLTVDILCSQSATTDYDLTGQVIWPVSCKFLHDPQHVIYINTYIYIEKIFGWISLIYFVSFSTT